MHCSDTSLSFLGRQMLYGWSVLGGHLDCRYNIVFLLYTITTMLRVETQSLAFKKLLSNIDQRSLYLIIMFSFKISWIRNKKFSY